jgi:hypothetical protein
VPQRLGSGTADAGVLGFFLNDFRLALRLDARQLQLVPHDFRQFRQRNFNLQNMLARIAAGLALAPFVRLAGTEWLADFSLAMADTAGTILAIAKVGHVKLGDWNADQVASLATDHFPLRDVLAEILADLATHNLAKSRLVSINLHYHRSGTPRFRHARFNHTACFGNQCLVSPRAKMLAT